MSEIDFIVTWVNPNDANWQKQYAYYKNEEITFEGEVGARYRENNMFKYWFRAVEKYAPWVRKIHVVTADQKPEWLNHQNEKINLVNHSDYIPNHYLPTFNSHTIELNLHRIEGLSEKFVYFNDDMFLNSIIKENFYFEDDLPKDSLILKPIAPYCIDSLQFAKILVNNTTIINKNFSLKEFIKNNKDKFYSTSYSRNIFKNYFYYKYNKFYIGFLNPHLPQPFLKSTFSEVWRKENELLNITCENKFRTGDDLSPYLFRYWHLASGKFYPINHKKLGSYFNICSKDSDRILNILNSEKCKQLCLNDSTNLDHEDSLNKIRSALESKFPQKSCFEI